MVLREIKAPKFKRNTIIRAMAKQLFKDYGYEAYDKFCIVNGPESRHSYIERKHGVQARTDPQQA